MGTKLKKISYHWAAKTVAFLLVCAMFGGFMTMGLNILFTENLSDFFTKDYVVSREAKNIVNTAYNHIYTLLSFKSEENIRSEEYRNNVDWWPGTTEASKDKEIESQIFGFKYAEKQLKGTDGIYYYATDGEVVFTNCQMTTVDEFEKFKFYHIQGGGVYLFNGINRSYSSEGADYTVYFAFDDGFIAQRQTAFELSKDELCNQLLLLSVMALLALLLLIYLIAVCGRKTDGGFKLMTIDRLWTEVTTSFAVAAVILYVALIANGIESFVKELPAIWGLASALFCGFGVMFLLSLVRRIKDRTFIKHSLIYKVFKFIWDKTKKICKTIFNFTPMNIKIICSVLAAEFFIFVLSGFLFVERAVFFPLLFMLISTAGALYFILKFVIKPYDDEVKARLESSIAKEMKAERLKTELITNVSHDLKTPLTAIINYSDLLLKRDENDEYAKVIYDKSRKLQHLTEDLFEVSKAQSGNISVNMENLNVSELINQTLAELDGHEIDFKLSVGDISVRADGKLMSRVFENLVGNILKYSLPNTRAYIDAYQKNGKTYITFKNIANYEMNFDSGEMTERFSRGDTSRTTDGNGLGLAIAQSYVEACGGRLNIAVDGDLFKVTVEF